VSYKRSRKRRMTLWSKLVILRSWPPRASEQSSGPEWEIRHVYFRPDVYGLVAIRALHANTLTG
jgi:hypothetical protein